MLLYNMKHTTDIEYDELGNIKDMTIPDYNRIKDEDDKIVVRQKMEAQTKALLKYLDASK